MGDDEEQSEATKVFVTMWNELRQDQRAEVMLALTEAIIASQPLVNMIIERAGIQAVITDLKNVSMRVDAVEHFVNVRKTLAQAQKAYENIMGVY